MKKFLILFILLVFVSPVFAANWVEVFEKNYLDVSSLEQHNNIVTFWVKSLRKDPKDVIPVLNKSYWFSLDRWNINCANKKERIDVVNVYGLKGELLYTDEYVPEWRTIVPDTYADGFYNMFCSVPFEDNPWFNPDLLK